MTGGSVFAQYRLDRDPTTCRILNKDLNKLRFRCAPIRLGPSDR